MDAEYLWSEYFLAQNHWQRLIHFPKTTTDTLLSVALFYDDFIEVNFSLRHKINKNKGIIMITLHQTQIEFVEGVNASPFCQKLQSFLEFHNLPHEVVFGLPDQGPLNKIPFVSYNEESLGDSELIIQRLAKDHDIDISLTPMAQVWQRTLEEHLYWVMVYSRWMDDDAWEILKVAFFSPVPKALRGIISRKARKLAKQNLYSQGVGRLSAEDVYQRGNKDLNALNDYLSDSKFIGSNTLCHVDFFAWALLRNIDNHKMPTKLSNIASGYANLEAYCLRVEAALAL
jgi:glutathione S-transferase